LLRSSLSLSRCHPSVNSCPPHAPPSPRALPGLGVQSNLPPRPSAKTAPPLPVTSFNYTVSSRHHILAAYRRVYDSRHLPADCQEPGSAPEPCARQWSTSYLLPLYTAQYISQLLIYTPQFCVEPLPSSLSTTLPAVADERRRTCSTVPAAVGRHLLRRRRSAANPPAAVDGTDQRTDSRPLHRDPGGHTTRTASIIMWVLYALPSKAEVSLVTRLGAVLTFPQPFCRGRGVALTGNPLRGGGIPGAPPETEDRPWLDGLSRLSRLHRISCETRNAHAGNKKSYKSLEAAAELATYH